MEKKNWFKTYLFIWIGQFISLLTSSAVNFAVIMWLSLSYKSAEILAYAAIAGLLPQALIGPFAGVYIDRWDRKKVMIFADAFIASCTFVMTFILKEGDINLYLLYSIMALRSIGSAFHSPAMQAIAPLLVPEDKLLRVSGVNQMLQSISSIAGPALGALAIAAFPINKVLYLDIIGACLAICSLLFVQIPNPKRERVSGSIKQVWRDLKLGFYAIHQNKGLNRMFLYAMLATVAIMPVAIMFPILTIEHFKGAELEMSIVESIWGVGMLLGGTVLSAFKLSFRKIVLVNAMHILLGLTFVLSGLLSADAFYLFVLVTGLGGMGMSIFSAAFMTIIQEEVAPEMLGRVFSLYFSFAILPSLVGLLFAGNIADSLGVATAFIIAGIFMVGIGLLSFLTPSLMTLGNGVTQNQEV
ncbi:MFS transporter [Sphingobacterium humi]|uniref:MFS transporter n=1 Tax=Sphingobacterium humi TaxID=1796905 RepID=A0A6N8KWM5_9SPHI|nr:MFS transporter [Sphingobacterium humi]MVZ61853.1 MFS transporter [Sphingobacterium humi]